MSSSSPDLSAKFDQHVAHEFVDMDVAATMATMTAGRQHLRQVFRRALARRHRDHSRLSYGRDRSTNTLLGS
jgi:hypothetical protein